jgi:hypothetical protein
MAREAKNHPGGMVRVKGDLALAEPPLPRPVPPSQPSMCPTSLALAGDEPAMAKIPRTTRLFALRSRVPGTHARWQVQLTSSQPRSQPSRRIHYAPKLIANRDGAIALDAEVPRCLSVSSRTSAMERRARTLAQLEPRRILAIGPGKTLRALVHRNLGVTREVEMIDSMRAIERSTCVSCCSWSRWSRAAHPRASGLAEQRTGGIRSKCAVMVGSTT